MSDEKQIIEVNGVKLEVDMRHARRIEELRVGSRVKVLDSRGYGGAEVHPGIVVGFEPFPSKPTIIIAFVKAAYNDVGLLILNYNADTEKVDSKFPRSRGLSAPFPHSSLRTSRPVLVLQAWPRGHAFSTRTSDRRERQKLDEKRAEIDAKEQFFVERFKSYWNDGELAEQVSA